MQCGVRLRVRGAVKDRDVYTPKHPTPVAGVPAFVSEEATGRYDGDELRAIRSKRPTDERIARLEDKHDELVATVTDVRVSIGAMSGKLDAFLGTISEERKQQHATEQVRIGSRAKVIVAIVGAISAAVAAAVTAMTGCA